MQEIQKGEIITWDKIWKKQHDEFEQQIKGTEWKDLNNKYLYTWDGYHRLVAWTKIIKQGITKVIKQGIKNLYNLVL